MLFRRDFTIAVPFCNQYLLEPTVSLGLRSSLTSMSSHTLVFSAFETTRAFMEVFVGIDHMPAVGTKSSWTRRRLRGETHRWRR